MTLRAYVFPILQTRKEVVMQMSKKSCFRRPFYKQHGKWSQILMKSARQLLCHIYCTPWKKLSREECLLVICKILRLFFNTWSANEKYSLLNRDTLTQPIEMQLYIKKIFCSYFFFFFFTFWKFRPNFEHFVKKDDPHILAISYVTDCKRRG